MVYQGSMTALAAENLPECQIFPVFPKFHLNRHKLGLSLVALLNRHYCRIKEDKTFAHDEQNI